MKKSSKRALLKPNKLLIMLFSGLVFIIILLESLKVIGVAIPALFFNMWITLFTLTFLIAFIDIVSLKKLVSPSLQRTLSNYLSLNRWDEVSIVISNQQNLAMTITLYDHPPTQIQFQQLPQYLQLAPQSQYLIKYRICPLQRGHFHWQQCEVIVTSQWRLWQQRRYIPLANETRVYPDFTKLYGTNLNTIEQWIYYLGVRPQPRRGLGQDFHQLREFREGDTLRQIDWKATARHRSPIAKEYQTEKDQQIIFLLDCGQRMRAQEETLSHFDHALNACLLLSYVALRQGDSVGLATFAADKNRFLKPQKGQQQLNILLNTVYDLQSTQQPADYLAAVQMLLANTKRRALVIVVTNLRYSEDNETLVALKLLNKHHKLLIASLREGIIDKLRTTDITNFDSAMTYCGDINHLVTRTQLHEKLAAYNLPIIDVKPIELAPQLVNHYLSLKRSGQL